jgi:trans-aconitate 2-methyltransferase
VVQCGGAGNVADVEAAVRRVGHPALAGWPGPWHFAGTAETAQRLRRLGFIDVWTWLQRVPVHPEDPREYLATVVLGSHLERLPEADRDAFIEAVLGELEEPVEIGYVRLNVLARRPA